MATCSNCNGSGYAYGSQMESCYRCGGSGRSGVNYNDACMACGGSGMSSQQKLTACTACGGSGQVADWGGGGGGGGGGGRIRGSAGQPQKFTLMNWLVFGLTYILAVGWLGPRMEEGSILPWIGALVPATLVGAWWKTLAWIAVILFAIAFFMNGKA